jgi:hypothetical protein
VCNLHVHYGPAELRDEFLFICGARIVLEILSLMSAVFSLIQLRVDDPREVVNYRLI